MSNLADSQSAIDERQLREREVCDNYNILFLYQFKCECFVIDHHFKQLLRDRQRIDDIIEQRANAQKAERDEYTRITHGSPLYAVNLKLEDEKILLKCAKKIFGGFFLGACMSVYVFPALRAH
jgi:hypothetical protein